MTDSKYGVPLAILSETAPVKPLEEVACTVVGPSGHGRCRAQFVDRADAERHVSCLQALDGFDPARVRNLLVALCGQTAGILNWANQARSCREMPHDKRPAT